MELYKNLSGDSGVVAYESGDDFIKVRFVDGRIYLYSYQSAGRELVERMKLLATSGRGLSGFISGAVRTLYASRSG